jgi:hypothetical protein
MTVELVEFTPAEAMLVWHEAEAYLSEAIDSNDKPAFLRGIHSKVATGVNSLWAFHENEEVLGYAITIIYTPDGLTRTAQIYLASVIDKSNLLSQLDQFEVWAMRQDVDYIEVVGRRGWERMLKPYGFIHNYTSLTKRVTQELH